MQLYSTFHIFMLLPLLLFCFFLTCILSQTYGVLYKHSMFAVIYKQIVMYFVFLLFLTHYGTIMFLLYFVAIPVEIEFILQYSILLCRSLILII